MQGSLKQYPLPEVLQFINMGKWTGLLVIKDRDGSRDSLSISQGRTSSTRAPSSANAAWVISSFTAA